ncbi:MAG TPA: hypothetical protein V6C84_26790 [Coleofasciculaceae cyanobacterium]|jgi:hypothetical protein
MSQPPSNSEHQPESPQPRIDQHSSGNSLGGQQAAIGNNINQFQDNSTNCNNFSFYNYYGELQDEDLEPLTLRGKILSYFGVFIVLVLTLIFWFFFGLFINFPFPFRQALELVGSCFRGKVGSKVNSLQKQLQLKDIDSLSIDKLNEVDFQARLYLEILECLGVDKVKNHERLAKTIETLKQRRIVLQDQIKPRQLKKYQTVSKAQDFFESLVLNQTEEDLVQIETILVEVTSSIRNGYPSETIIQNTLDKLSKEVTRKAGKISPIRLGLLYRIEALLHEVSAKEISNLEESELQNFNKKIINELREERDLLAKKLKRLSDEKNATQQTLEEYLGELSRLNGLIEERETDLSNLRKRISYYAETDRSQTNTVNALNSDLEKANERLRDLQGQKINLSQEISQLKQTLQRKQVSIGQLESQVNQYSGIRMLKGEYIGNLSDPKAKYHFDRKCNHWKMLVGEYVLGLDQSREIVSSSTPTFFFRKLEECDRCAGRRNSY